MVRPIALSLLIVIGVGCASSGRSSKPDAPSGFGGHWQSTGPCDYGNPVGMVSVRLDLKHDGTWREDLTRADGTAGGVSSGVWAPLEQHKALLRNGPGYNYACPIELVDANTLRMGGGDKPTFEFRRAE